MATTEERLAALETKLATLTATTPTEYYTHQYSGEEIDAAVGRAVSGGALDTSVSNVSNQMGTFTRPNLLDNWYFGNPVNQRGQTEYTEAWSYGLDRWLCGGDGKCWVNDNYCTCFGAIDQGLSIKMSDIENKLLTASLLFADGSLLSGSAVDTNQSIEIIFWSNIKETYCGFNSTDLFKHRRFRLYFNKNTPIFAAKLELGPNQTLAHREGDKWVINEVPDYGEQLRRCLSYFARLSGDSQWSVVGIAKCDGSNIADLVFWLPVPMRTRPSVVASGLTVNGVAVTSITADQYNPTCLKYKGTLAANVPAGIYVIEQSGSGYVDVSADL